MSGCMSPFLTISHNRGYKKSSSASPPAKSKTLKRSVAKGVQVPGSEAQMSDEDEKTIYGSCRSSMSSVSDNQERNKVPKKKGQESNPSSDSLKLKSYGHRSGRGRSTEPDKHSRIYPDLNHILAVDSTHLVYDVRRRPKDSIPEEIYENYKDINATKRPTMHMRIISECFPWTIDVKVTSADTHTIRVRDLWKALYKELQEPISDSEWAVLGMRDLVSPKKRESILAAAQRRGENMKKLRRIDWLGSRTKFCGLYKEEDAERRLLLPSAPDCPETWVADFANHR